MASEYYFQKPLLFFKIACARDKIRTCTPFRAPPPQSGLSTNFNTRALTINNE